MESARQRAGPMNRTRLLFLATHPKEVASTRYRVLAYRPALEQEGFRVEFESFFPSESLREIHAEGRWAKKLHWVLSGAWARRKTLRQGPYDLVLVHRELFPWGAGPATALLLRQLRGAARRIIYDFDDALYLPHRRERWPIGRLENPASARALIVASDCVLAGNAHLAGYARRYHRRVIHMPTPVDTRQFAPGQNGAPSPVKTIGWIGSPSTAKYLYSLSPVLAGLARRFAFRVKVVGAGRPHPMPGVAVDWKPWTLASEAEEFRTCDLGVYPLWDDEWARGKCGFKALQFMACGVPVVASAVGMNTEIIRDGDNGLLAAGTQEWHEKLSRLLEDDALRLRLGAAGRRTIQAHYALERVAPRWLGVIRDVLAGREPADAGAATAEGDGRPDTDDLAAEARTG